MIGSEFYVMERVDGLIPRRELPPEVDLDEAAARRLCTNALDVLIELHRIDADASAELGALGKGTGYVERQVERLVDALPQRAHRGRRSTDRASGDGLAGRAPARRRRELRDPQRLPLRQPGARPGRPDPGGRRARLGDGDLGDPLMDLGGTLAYWVQDDDDEFFRQFRRQPTHLPGMLSREEVVRLLLRRGWATRSPRSSGGSTRSSGCSGSAVIAQQIYYRYFHGQTHNEAYAVFGPAAQYLEAALQPDHRRA